MAVDASSETAPQSTRKIVAAGAVGNALEWYDFAVYGFLAPIIAPLFFPSDDPFSSLLAVYGAFAAGYLARPIGGFVFGYIGDKFGRRPVLILTVTMMGFGSLAIGLLPTAESVGAVAGLLLVLVRVIQGISVGGEYPGSAVFVAEGSPPGRRGFLTSFIFSGAVGGFLIGSGAAALLTTLFEKETIEAGLWRIPFIAGVIILAASFTLRRSVMRPERSDGKPPVRSPIITTFQDHWRDVLKVLGIAIGGGVPFYVLFVYAISYLTEEMHDDAATAMDINTLCLFVLMVLAPVAALLSDKVGRKPVAMTGLAVMIIVAIPAFWLMHSKDPMVILAGQIALTIPFACYASISPVLLAEVPSAAVRVSVASIGYNVILALFGGTVPLVATYLVGRLGDDYFPAYYIMAAAGVSFVTLFFVQERRNEPLEPV
ncbi:MAG: MFS transporter [Pseudomonadota bacterium]